jgi:hypothetical protein
MNNNDKSVVKIRKDTMGVNMGNGAGFSNTHETCPHLDMFQERLGEQIY